MPRPKLWIAPSHYFSRKKNGRGVLTYLFVVEERRRKLSFQGKGNGRFGKIYKYICVVSSSPSQIEGRGYIMCM